jgi:hypothetical protein
MLGRLSVAVGLLLLPCLAQETSQITGRITDASGAAIPGASVQIVQVSTNVKWDVRTNADGYYTQALLPPSSYRVTVNLTGFKQEAQNVALVMEQIARLDFTLQVGSQTETIEISGAAPLLESSNASIGQVVDTQPIQDLPLNGRNYLDLAKLTIGVTEPSGFGTTGTTGDRAKNGGAFIANGVRSDQNNFTLDGVDNNSKIPDLSSNSNVVIQPSVDAIGEFKVETNTYSPEYGHSGGAVLSVITKSGNNRLHGDAFEYLRNDAVDAKNFFIPPSQPKQDLKQNQYGATLGGPVIKNKTFFFGSWQGSRQVTGTTYVSTLPSPAMIAGNFSSLLPKTAITDPNAVTVNANGTFNRPVFPGNIIPPSRFSQPAAQVSALIPAPDVPGAGAANNYISTPVATNNRNVYDTRGDQNFSDKDKFFLAYHYYALYFYNPGPLPLPLVGSTGFQQSINNQSGHQATLGETHVFSPTLTNEFRAGYNRISNALRDFNSQNLDAQYGFGYIPPHPNLTGLPQLTLTGYSNLGEATFLPDTKGSDSFQVTDSLTWIRGKHFIRTGFEYLWQRSRFDIDADARGLFNFNGQFTGNGYSDFLLGLPQQETLNGETYGDLRYKYYGAYVADDWKVAPKLTLNLGLRWEFEGAPYERNNQESNFIVGPNIMIFPNNNIPPATLIPASLAGMIPSGVNSRALLREYPWNFAPRVGLAYQLANRTVLRMGAGEFVSETDAAGASTRPVFNPPFHTTYNPPAGNGVQPTYTLTSGVPANAENPTSFNQSTSALISWNPNFKPARVYKWSADIQQEVGKFLIDVGYIGTKGTDLSVQYNANQAVAGPGTQASRFPYQGFNTMTLVTPMGNSEYDALQMRVERRFANGFSLLSSFSWSKSIDLGSGGLIGDLSVRNIYDVSWERAVSSGSVPLRWVTSYSYQLPVGTGKAYDPKNRVLGTLIGNWQVNGIATLRDGQPFTPSSSVNSANTNGRNALNWNPAVQTPGFTPSVADWFDTAAFSQPASYVYGNEGRDILMGPGAINFDASIMKLFKVPKLGEGGTIQLRFEGFNIFNHPQFAVPSNVTIGTAGVGSLVATTTGMRILQVGLKVIF